MTLRRRERKKSQLTYEAAFQGSGGIESIKLKELEQCYATGTSPRLAVGEGPGGGREMKERRPNFRPFWTGQGTTFRFNLWLISFRAKEFGNLRK